MIYNCLNCKKELVSARSTKKYCSTKCRVYHHRGLSVTDSVTIIPLSVTENDEKKDSPRISVTNDVSEMLQKANSVLNKAKVSVTEEVYYDTDEV